MRTTRQPDADGTRSFARQFLSQNWGRVLQLVLLQGFLVWDAAQGRWFMCVMWLLFSGQHVWHLVERAAGVQEPVVRIRTREEMTPREAFWLLGPSIFDRERKHSSN